MCFSVSFCLPLTVHQFPPRLSFVLCSSVLFSHHQFLPAFPAPHWSVLYLVLCFIICYRICPCLLLFCSSDHSFALFKLSFLFLPRCFCIFLPNWTLCLIMDETGPEEKRHASRFHWTWCQALHLATFASCITCLTHWRLLLIFFLLPPLVLESLSGNNGSWEHTYTHTLSVCLNLKSFISDANCRSWLLIAFCRFLGCSFCFVFKICFAVSGKSPLYFCILVFI